MFKDVLGDHFPAFVTGIVTIVVASIMGLLGWATLAFHTDPSDHEVILLVIQGLATLTGASGGYTIGRAASSRSAAEPSSPPSVPAAGVTA